MKFWIRKLFVAFLLLAPVAVGIWGVVKLRSASTDIVFRAGLHDATTGEELGTLFDVVAEDTVIVVAKFWASWCRPCVTEAPDLQKAHRYFQASFGTKVMLVGVNVGESDGKVKEFAGEHLLTFPMLGGVTAPQFSRGLPRTVVFQKKDGEWEQVAQREGAVPHTLLLDTIDVIYADMRVGE